MSNVAALPSECLSCEMRDGGPLPADKVLLVLMLMLTLDGVQPEHIEQNMCFAHRRELREARASVGRLVDGKEPSA